MSQHRVSKPSISSAETREFVGHLAHDLNNILGISIAYNSLAKDNPDIQNNAGVIDLLQIVEQSNNRMQRVLEQMRRFAQAPDIQLALIDCYALLRDVAQDLELVSPTATTAETTVITDPLVLNDAVRSLISFFKSAGAPNDALSVKVNAAGPGSFQCAICEFNGNPAKAVTINLYCDLDIDTQTLKKLFEPYTRIPTLGLSTGFDLAIAANELHQAGAHINCTKDSNNFTVVSIYLPLSSNT